MRSLALLLSLAVAGGASHSGTLKTTIPVAGIHRGGTFAYAGAAVDSTTSRYFLADRTNASLDVFDTRKLRQIGRVKDRLASPGAVVVAGGNVYVGDTGKVHVIDEKTLVPRKQIAIDASRFGIDDGCYDAGDELLMLTSPLETPPFVTWISTKTHTVYARLTFNGSAGVPTAATLGSCVYDSGTKKFYLNNSGSTMHPRGELDAITAKSIIAKTPVVSAAFDLRRCGPTGLVLGERPVLPAPAM